MRKALLTSTALLALTFGMSGCGYLSDKADGDRQAHDLNTVEVQPLDVSNDLEQLGNVDDMAVLESIEAEKYMPATYPNENAEDRFIRLELAVNELKTDVDTMKPLYANLHLLQNEIHSLLGEIRALRMQDGTRLELAPPSKNNITPPMAPEPAPMAPAMAPPKALTTSMVPVTPPSERPKPIMDKASVAVAKTPAAGATTPEKTATHSGAPVIKSVRVGDDAKKMRLVFDVAGTPSVTHDFDASENIFTVSFKDAQIGPEAKLSKTKGSLIAAVSEADAGSGKLVIFALNRATKLVNQGVIAPNNDSPQTRVFFDFSK